jgi:hypothetical protein
VILIQDLLEGLFQQPALVQFAAFAATNLMFVGLAFAFLTSCRRRQARPAEWIPVAPFATSITTMFALFLAFHASGIWANKNRAEQAHTSATMAIKRLDEALGPGQLDRTEFRQLLHRYVEYVERDEWRHARNRVVSQRATAAFRDLHGMAVAAARDLPTPTGSHLFALLDQVAHSRADKLWLGANHTEASSWLIVFALAAVAYFAIAAVHFDRPKAGLVALLLFASATTVAYTSLGMIDDPYRYLDSLDPSGRISKD